MDNYLANKIIEDLTMGTMTPQEGWTNLLECRETISDEKHDEISALITEVLLQTEVVEEIEELNLDDLFADEEKLQQIDDDWDDWGYNNISSIDPEQD